MFAVCNVHWQVNVVVWIEQVLSFCLELFEYTSLCLCRVEYLTRMHYVCMGCATVELVRFHMSHMCHTAHISLAHPFKKFKTRVKNKNFIPSAQRILSCSVDFAAAVLIFGFCLKVEKGRTKKGASNVYLLIARIPMRMWMHRCIELHSQSTHCTLHTHYTPHTPNMRNIFRLIWQVWAATVHSSCVHIWVNRSSSLSFLSCIRVSVQHK